MSHDQTMLSSINTGQYSFSNQLNAYFFKVKNPKLGLFGLEISCGGHQITEVKLLYQIFFFLNVTFLDL